MTKLIDIRPEKCQLCFNVDHILRSFLFRLFAAAFAVFLNTFVWMPLLKGTLLNKYEQLYKNLIAIIDRINFKRMKQNIWINSYQIWNTFPMEFDTSICGDFLRREMSVSKWHLLIWKHNLTFDTSIQL